MDARDSLVTSGSSLPSYYIQHRGTTAPPSGFHAPHPGGGYRHHLDATGPAFSFQTPPMGPNPHIGQGQALHVETSPLMSQHSAAAGIDTAGAGATANVKGEQGSGGGVNQDEQVKRKRGRPRKYKPDGTTTVTLGLSPSSSTPPSSSSAMVTVSAAPGSGGPSDKRRGRPPGSGKMQQLASLGKCFIGSVGTGFTPHVIIISSGEDVAARIMSFSQQGPRAVCIMSATGAVSTAALHQDASSGSVVTYEFTVIRWTLALGDSKILTLMERMTLGDEGRFEILCLSGSYLVIDDGGSRTRSGGLCIALCGPDHRVIGGSVGGVLTAAGTVQVMVGSFMYAGSKKNKGKAEQEEETEEVYGGGGGGGEEESPLMLTMPHDDLSSHPMSGWPVMTRTRHMDSRSSNIDINSIRE